MCDRRLFLAAAVRLAWKSSNFSTAYKPHDARGCLARYPRYYRAIYSITSLTNLNLFLEEQWRWPISRALREFDWTCAYTRALVGAGAQAEPDLDRLAGEALGGGRDTPSERPADEHPAHIANAARGA